MSELKRIMPTTPVPGLCAVVPTGITIAPVLLIVASPFIVTSLVAKSPVIKLFVVLFAIINLFEIAVCVLPAWCPIKTFPEPPYYDDFNETKNYHRVLYRPGYAVQARELTQMQTAMQAQIDRFGQYAFKHGSRVVGGKVTINTQYDFIKIDSSFTHSVGGTVNTDGYLSSFVGLTITGGANAGTPITAKVIAVLASDGLDPNTLYIKYTNTIVLL